MEVRQAQELGRSHEAGRGGWPTLKYFNKDTGLAGAKYIQKQEGPVCEEMKVPANMESWVREVGLKEAKQQEL